MSIKLTVPRSNLIAATAASALLAALACIATASAQSQNGSLGQPTQPTTAKGDLARCQQLFSQRSHYHANGSEPTSQDVAAEMAMKDCRAGRTEAGIAALEGMLRSKGIPVPQPEAAQSR